MSTSVRVAAFAMALAIAFLSARAVGAALSPVATAPASMAHDEGPDAQDTTARDDEGHPTGPDAAAASPGGLAVSAAGHTLRLHQPVRPAGEDVPVRFTVTGPDGDPVTDYAVEHEKQLHLVAVRRDLTGYQYVHPRLADDGSWSTTLDLRPGAWRLVADFRPAGGDATVLGADLAVPGEQRPAGPATLTSRTTVDGYQVALEGGLTAGTTVAVTVSVHRDGRPVTDLQPYLGARGHLVALREGDLAYLHVHPVADYDAAAGPDVDFGVEVPTVGRYRLFFDFRHGGRLHTAELAVAAPAGGTGSGEGDDHEH